MPFISNYLEQVNGLLYDTATVKGNECLDLFTVPLSPLSWGKGPDATNMYYSRGLPVGETFVATRIRGEVLDGFQGDIARLKKYASIQFINANKVQSEITFSTILLEDWLRKELRKIKKGQHRKIDRYLKRAFVCSLGALLPTTLEPPFFVRFRVPAELADQCVVRLYIEGKLFRPVM